MKVSCSCIFQVVLFSPLLIPIYTKIQLQIAKFIKSLMLISNNVDDDDDDNDDDC